MSTKIFLALFVTIYCSVQVQSASQDCYPSKFQIETHESSTVNGTYFFIPLHSKMWNIYRGFPGRIISYLFTCDKIYTDFNSHFLTVDQSKSTGGYDWSLVTIRLKRLPFISYQGHTTSLSHFGIYNRISIFDVSLNISHASLSISQNQETQTDPEYQASFQQALYHRLLGTEHALQWERNISSELRLQVQEKEIKRANDADVYKRIMRMLTVIVITLIIVIIIVLICYSLKLNKERKEKVAVLL